MCVVKENWEAWTGAMRAMTKASYLSEKSMGEQFVSISVLHEKTKQRMFVPDYDETIRNFVDRLFREASQLQPTWAFSAIVAPHAVYDGDGDPPAVDMNDTEQIKAALDAGVLEIGIFWFSERNDEQGRSELSGVIEFNEGGLPLIDVDAGVDDEYNPFFGILARGHEKE